MKNLLTILTLLVVINVFSQENIKYQKPSKEILNLVEFERPPNVLYDDNKNYMVFLYRNNYKSIFRTYWQLSIQYLHTNSFQSI
ncbi:MAG: hypothetical protein ACPGKX_03130, partial [Flavobacteriaceae bacterium]